MTRVDGLNLASRPMQRIILLLALTLLLLVSILSSPGITVTLDEPLHYHYGLRLLEGNSERIDDSSMPVSALNALPSYIATHLPAGALKSILERYFIARLVTVLFSAGVAALVFHWSRALYGFAAALLSLLLYVLDPNILAHSQLVTTDIFAAGMTAFTFYFLWKFANTRAVRHGLAFACLLGLSQLVKYTAAALYPLSLLALLLHDLPVLRTSYAADGLQAIGRYTRRLIFYGTAVLLVSVIIINIGFLFNRTWTPLAGYNFRSNAFRSLAGRLPWLARVPLPLPYPYVQGLDWVRHTDEAGDRYGNVYLLGQTRKTGGFPGYYLVAAALKVPIATQLFVLAGVIAYAASPRRRARFMRDELFFALPVVAYSVYFNFFFHSQIGIRYYLTTFPLLYVFTGNLLSDWRAVPAWTKAISGVLILYLGASVFSYFPYFIPYFNELVWDKTQTYRYLSDSNLDWGQSQTALQQYLAAHPGAVYDPPAMQPGLLVVGGSDLVGVLTPPAKYAWLRDNFRPIGTVAYAYFVYEITPEEITALCATSAGCK